MAKGQITRQRIVIEAAALFNQKGYAGTSLSDLMAATGLQKGGLYNHFHNKDEIAIAAFDYAVDQMTRLYRQALRQERQAPKRMIAILEIYRTLVESPPVPGGCPLLNAAVESDDTHPLLRSQVQRAMDSWRSLLGQVLQKGIARGEVIPTLDVDHAVTLFIATLEGAVMLSKLYDDGHYLQQVINHLRQYINNFSILTPPIPSRPPG